MFPSSAIQVVEQTPAKLVILDPPYYFLGGIAVFLTLLAAAQFGLVLVFQKRTNHVVGWIVMVLLLPFLLVGVGLLTARTTITFSRDTGKVSVEKMRFGIRWPAQDIPLGDIQSAGVQTERYTKSLTVVLGSGSVVRLTGFTSQGGQHEAARVINNFLAGKLVQ